jgi:hypothetical protein
MPTMCGFVEESTHPFNDVAGYATVPPLTAEARFRPALDDFQG